MPRRTQQAEVWLAGLGEIERLERAADAAKGVVADAFVVGGVAVEIVRLGQSLKVVGRVGAQHLGLGRGFRLEPLELEVGLFLEFLTGPLTRNGRSDARASDKPCSVRR